MRVWTVLSAVFLILSIPACAQNKQLGIEEVCFSRVNEIGDLTLRCYDKNGTEYDRTDQTADKYTCFNPKEAAKISVFIDKCLKAGVKP